MFLDYQSMINDWRPFSLGVRLRRECATAV
jgi:hypothetical protein